jgi:predicted hydrocarbon binding protein
MSLKGNLPNQVLNLTLTTLDEVMGQKGTKSILNYTGLQKFIDNYPPYNLDLDQSSEVFSHLLTGVISIMGVKGARPILFRGGMRGFEIMRENYPGLWNLEGIEPTERTPAKLFSEFVRIQGIIVAASTQIFGDIYKMYECDEGLALENHDCYWCKGLTTEVPVCFGSCGFNYAIAKWIVGPDTKVEETQCHAAGAAFCKFIMYRPGT